MTTETIIAIDLGRHNSVACIRQCSTATHLPYPRYDTRRTHAAARTPPRRTRGHRGLRQCRMGSHRHWTASDLSSRLQHQPAHRLNELARTTWVRNSSCQHRIGQMAVPHLRHMTAS
jgi:hypothetical protein